MVFNDQNTEHKFAELGDIIESTVQNPYPYTWKARLDTQEALAYGNKLIADGRWKLHEPCGHPTCMCRTRG